jgi:hypothetical protein
MDNLQEIRRGDDARQILESPLYKEAIQKVREGLINAMQQSPLGDEKTHNRLVIGLQFLAQVERQLTDVMMTGKMAQIQAKDGVVTRMKQVFRG